jgi:mono/diheme cytochrome c family protein
LRRGGAIAVIDPLGGKLVRRDAACVYPRGIAYDPASDAVHVACAGGELVTLSAKDGQPTRTLMLPRDLRDVVVDGDHLLVSRFRSAELLVLDAEGSVVSTIRPPGLLTDPSRQLAPAVAWRTMAAPGGGVLMIHEQEQVGDVLIQPGGYGGFSCGSIVQSAVSLLRRDGTGWTAPISLALAIDLALGDGDAPTLYISSAGLPQHASTTPVVSFALPVVPPNQTGPFDAGIGAVGPLGGPCSPLGDQIAISAGPVVAVGVDWSGAPILQSREPFALIGTRGTVILPGDIRRDTGRDIFHLATSAGLACASCHPEGRDDGHIWHFASLGSRRTQSLGGGILGTEPFHWNGDMTDFSTLAHEVFNGRMLGPALQDDYVTALSKWIDAIPAWKPGASGDAAAIERGRALFNSAQAACSTCHTGAKLTNNNSVDVGTGGKFQVPSLRGVAWRTPLMHDGCAPSLSDRFGTCGGTKHGNVPTGGTGQADLVAYLESL